MKTKTMIYLSHFATLFFGISLGMILTIWYQFTFVEQMISKTLIIPALAILPIAIIIRIVTMRAFKKSKFKICEE
ncbi:MAG: hypothetical protein KAS53_01765 [Candidatus Cloacimonetes bacterium]|nr:hypothetical protein [Candidatus Cloacimonadota bacterium]